MSLVPYNQSLVEDPEVIYTNRYPRTRNKSWKQLAAEKAYKYAQRKYKEKTPEMDKYYDKMTALYRQNYKLKYQLNPNWINKFNYYTDPYISEAARPVGRLGALLPSSLRLTEDDFRKLNKENKRLQWKLDRRRQAALDLGRNIRPFGKTKIPRSLPAPMVFGKIRDKPRKKRKRPSTVNYGVKHVYDQGINKSSNFVSVPYGRRKTFRIRKRHRR
jgi:hypothetical protein